MFLAEHGRVFEKALRCFLPDRQPARYLFYQITTRSAGDKYIGSPS